jgi:hypothetical protein
MQAYERFFFQFRAFFSISFSHKLKSSFKVNSPEGGRMKRTYQNVNPDTLSKKGHLEIPFLDAQHSCSLKKTRKIEDAKTRSAFL